MKQVDVLAIAAHPDDIELICGGTLIRAHSLGRVTGILDLAAGELITSGSGSPRPSVWWWDSAWRSSSTVSTPAMMSTSPGS